MHSGKIALLAFLLATIILSCVACECAGHSTQPVMYCDANGCILWELDVCPAGY